jgi:hypothetical protein
MALIINNILSLKTIVSAAAQAAWKVAHPPILGARLDNSAQKVSISKYTSFHGTAWTDDIRAQVNRGQFEDRTARVYVGKNYVARVYAHIKTVDTQKKPVLLVVQPTLLQKDEIYHTYYCPPTHPPKILAAYEVNPLYIEVNTMPLSLLVKRCFVASRHAVLNHTALKTNRIQAKVFTY